MPSIHPKRHAPALLVLLMCLLAALPASKADEVKDTLTDTIVADEEAASWIDPRGIYSSVTSARDGCVIRNTHHVERQCQRRDVSPKSRTFVFDVGEIDFSRSTVDSDGRIILKFHDWAFENYDAIQEQLDAFARNPDVSQLGNLNLERALVLARETRRLLSERGLVSIIQQSQCNGTEIVSLYLMDFFLVRAKPEFADDYFEYLRSVQKENRCYR